MDSDDWIDICTLQKTLEVAEKLNAQIVAFNYSEVCLSDYSPCITDKYEILNSQQAIENTMDNINVRTVVWNKLYYSGILKKLRFKKGVLHEDEFFTFYALDNAETIVYLYREFYFYFQRTSSIMNTAHIECTDALEGMRNRMLFVQSKYPELLSKAKIILSSSCLNQYSALLKCKCNRRNSLNKVKAIRKSFRISLNDVKTISTKYALMHLFSNFSLGLKLFAVIKRC